MTSAKSGGWGRDGVGGDLGAAAKRQMARGVVAQRQMQEKHLQALRNLEPPRIEVMPRGHKL